MVMKSLMLQLGITLTLLCLSCQAMAQSDVALATRTADLQALSLAAQKRDQADRRRVSEDDPVGPGDTLTVEQSFF